MSTFAKYDSTLVQVDRADTGPSTVGGYVGGYVGTAVGSWEAMSVNGLSYSIGYDPDENGTPIYGTETLSLSKAFWGDPDAPPLRVGQKIRVRYSDAWEFLGTVDKVSRRRGDVPIARRHGVKFKVTFTASVLGTYAVALSRKVCWPEELPNESPLERIQRFGVTVIGYA